MSSAAIKQNFWQRFFLRWLVCSLGLWVAAGLLGSVSYAGGLGVTLVAGFFLAAINAFIRPLLILLSLPAILLSLGLFMVVINGFTVLLVSWLYKPLEISNFWGAVLAGLIIGLVNYLVSAILENKHEYI